MKKIFTLLFFLSFFTTDLYAQCAGTSGSITICSKETYNEGLGLGKVDLNLIITGETGGGTWAETTQAPCVSGAGVGLNPTTGVLNIWQIRRGCVYEYTYTAPAGCGGGTSTVTLTLGGFPGFGTNGDACIDVSDVNLYSFLGSNPNPDNNGDFTSFDAPPGTINGNMFDAQATGVGTYNFSYTVPAVGTCPSRSTSFNITVNPKPEAGTTIPLDLYEMDDLSGYTTFDLVSLFNASPVRDPGGDWEDTTATPGPANTTDGIANMSDSVINLQAIFNTASGGDGILDQDLVLTFRYSVYPSHPICNPEDRADFTITIRKTVCPIANATPTSQSICSGDSTSITLSSDISGTTYSWYCMQSGVTGAMSGSGNVISQILTTTETNPGSVDYIITPTANSCTGNSITVTVTVNPTPEVFGAPSGSICSGSSPYVSLNASIPGTTFSWTVVQTGVAGASSGSGNIINQVLYTTGATNGTVVYTVTPVAGGCQGDPLNISVTVNPSPNPAITDGTICVDQSSGNSFTTYTLDTGLSNSTYDFVWYLDNVIVPGAVNSTHAASLSGTYTVEVTNSTTGCVFPAGLITATVTQNYPPNTSISAPIAILNGESSNVVLTSDMPSNSVFDWTVNQNGVIGAVAGTGNTIDQVLTTTGILPGTAEYAIHTSDLNGCTDTTDLIQILVLYVPGIGDGIIGTEAGTGNVVQPYLLDTGLRDSNYTCEWTLNGVAFRGINDVNNVITNQYYATQAGTYCVIATNATTGFRSLEACADVTTQTLSNSEFNTISLVYSPNPVSDVLTIIAKETLKKVTVFNTLGQVVYSKTFNDLNPQLELSNLVSGNYFVKVEADNKQNVFKIIKR